VYPAITLPGAGPGTGGGSHPQPSFHCIYSPFAVGISGTHRICKME
jgi:hypothetical protein